MSSKLIEPEQLNFLDNKPSKDSAVIVFPLPDSPTIARISFF